MEPIDIARLRAEYIAANPKSQQAFERACQSLPGGSTRSSLHHDPFPLTLESGQGCYVTSVDGVEYLDLMGEFSAGLFGHSHPRIQEAVAAALSSGMNLGSHGEKEVELAERLLKRFQSMQMIRFCNSGTESNTYALALALHHTQRSKVCIAFVILTRMILKLLDSCLSGWVSRRNIDFSKRTLSDKPSS